MTEDWAGLRGLEVGVELSLGSNQGGIIKRVISQIWAAQRKRSSSQFSSPAPNSPSAYHQIGTL